MHNCKELIEYLEVTKDLTKSRFFGGLDEYVIERNGKTICPACEQECEPIEHRIPLPYKKSAI